MTDPKRHGPGGVLILVFALAVAGVAAAALLGLTPEFPRISFDSQGTTSYDAANDQLSILAQALTIRPVLGDPPSLISGGNFFIDAEIDASGGLIGGVPGDDLLLNGSVVIGGNPFTTPLLTGEILEFGFEDGGGNTDFFDFRFEVTGGSLASLYFGSDLVVSVASEGSDFSGDFNVDFGGGAKGNLGSTPRPPVCGDALLDPGEECDPPGGPSQCTGGLICDATCTCVPPPTDHFKCYKTTQIDRPRFQARDVNLVDQFGASTVSVRKPTRLCNPADKNGEGIFDPTRHLMCYKLKERGFQKREVLVTNQFGQQRLSVLRPEEVCVPAEKDGVPVENAIDHFKCYKVRRAKGESKFIKRTVSVVDQFESKQTIVVKPRLLCNPVDKNGEGIIDPEAHLACYRIKDVSGQPRFQRREVTVVDQFADQNLKALRGSCRRVSYLCVPSTKQEL